MIFSWLVVIAMLKSQDPLNLCSQVSLSLLCRVLVPSVSFASSLITFLNALDGVSADKMRLHDTTIVFPPV